MFDFVMKMLFYLILSVILFILSVHFRSREI